MLDSIIKNCNKDLEDSFRKIDDIEEFNSKKVLDAFIENGVCETDFNSATGYGYNDIGRDKIEKVYASIFKAGTFKDTEIKGVGQHYYRIIFS